MAQSRSFEVPAPRPLTEQRGETFERLVALMQRLLAADGCPWDREQTYASLGPYVLEEACEVIDAIDGKDPGALREELGDLLLQVVFLAELARADDHFGPDDVVRGICDKLVRRHPHVFADAEASDSEAVSRQWEAIKAMEKPGERGLLARVPRSLPPLEGALRLSERASRVGFDWPDAAASRAKVGEELLELDQATRIGDLRQVESELGDLLFAIVNLARKHGLDAGVALRGTCDRFRRRFAHVERRVESDHGGWPRNAEGKPTSGIGLDRLDAYWNEAKAERGEER